MRTIRKHVKRVGASAVAIAVSALSTIAVAPPAAALEGEPIVYDARPGSTLKKDYTFPMPANDAAGAFHEPGLCAKVPSCTEIPLKIQVPPGFDPETGDFVVYVTLSWKVAGSPDENAVNDLDLYIYDMNRVNEETGEEEPAVAAQSATGAMPEVGKMFSPGAGIDYRILVSNFTGPNQGFTLEFEFKDFSFEPPDEGGSLGGSTAGGGDEGTFESDPAASDTETGDDFGDADLAAPPALDGSESAALPIPDADNDFSDGFSLPSGGAAGRAPSLFGETEGAAKPGPVAGAVLAAWLGVAPIALLAAAIAFILKRRPTALSMAFPSGPVAVDRPVDA